MWTQIREGLLGVPVEPSPHSEAAYGSALLARQGAAAAFCDPTALVSRLALSATPGSPWS